MGNEEAAKVIEEMIHVNKKIICASSEFGCNRPVDDFDRFIMNQNSALEVALRCLKLCNEMNAEKILEISDVYLKAILDIDSKKRP
jgi:hypothetical protein